ncbi:MAG: FAD synthetase family protein [Treponema sp.]|jgi:riboflavin kinase/FMN adenylyltransferase|nr:FAD synthetase family protein [Treponema sp.]
MLTIDWETFIDPAGRPLGEHSLGLSIGGFDGVHRGHQKLIGKVLDYAGSHGGLGGIITFRQNPRSVLHPQSYPGDIYSLPQKLKTLEGLGAAFTVLIDFSGDFSKLSGKEFISLLGRRRIAYLAVGANFRCGYRLDTDARGIQLLAGGALTEVVPPLKEGGAPVSSSRIRQAIGAGNLREASLLLGRPYRMDLAGLRVREVRGEWLWDLTGRAAPPGGRYAAAAYDANSNEGLRTDIVIDSGQLILKQTSFFPTAVELLETCSP